MATILVWEDINKWPCWWKSCSLENRTLLIDVFFPFVSLNQYNCWKTMLQTTFVMSGSAPYSRSCSTASSCPWHAANDRAVSPLGLQAVASAPLCSNTDRVAFCKKMIIVPLRLINACVANGGWVLKDLGTGTNNPNPGRWDTPQACPTHNMQRRRWLLELPEDATENATRK